MFISLNGFSQQGGWEKFYTQNGSRSAKDIKQTSDGGYLITGFSNPTNSFFGQDIMILKIDGDGEFEWSINHDAGGSSDHGQRAMETVSGDYVAVGFGSNPSSGTSNGYFLRTTSEGGVVSSWFDSSADASMFHDLVNIPSDSSIIICGRRNDNPYLVRTDKHGDTLYTKRFTDITGVFQAVTCSEDGEFLYSAGYSSSPSVGIVIKSDLEGNVIWQTFFDTGDEQYYDILVDNINVYVVGMSLENSSNGYHQCLIRNFSEIDGQMSFFKVFDRGSFNKMVKEPDGNGFVLLGTSYFFTGAHFEQRVYVVKTDSEGELIWEREFGQNYPASNLGWGICKGHDYGYMVCGQFTSADGIPYVYVIKIDENGSVVSTNSFPFLPEISLYPNPCTEVLNIQLGTFESEKRITVLNSAGQEVYEKTTFDNEIQINEVSFWPSGVYLVHVEVEGHKVVRKVVVDY